MVTTEYKIAYSEVLEILKYISKEDFNKVPRNMIEMFKANASTENKFKYNPEKTLKEQDVSEIARIIIAILFRDYWATEIQKQKILAKQNFDRKNIKKEKYNPDNLFKKNKTDESIEKDIQTENMSIVEYKEPLYKRFITKIKNIFHIN